MSSHLIFKFIKIYWKTFFTVIYPIALLPVFLCNNKVELRCLYVVCLMAGFWIVEVIPLQVTSLIPVVLFPLMGILDTEKTSICYFQEAIMMFVGGFTIALSLEFCNLHVRVALYAMKLVGCSYRRLRLSLNVITFFVSMWMSNVAATAMMVPIVEATLLELENQGIGKRFEDDKDDEDEVNRKPTKPTMCFFISTAYSATFGGLSCLIGSITNLTFSGLYDGFFPESPGLEFNKWFMCNFPMAVLMITLTWIWLEVWFMGLFRPKSRDAQLINIGREGEETARDIIKTKTKNLGRITLHEILVAILFVLAIMLWIFEHPKSFKGWAERITSTNIKDATPAIFVVLFLFILPAQATFLYACDKNPEKRPTTHSPALLSWKFVKDKMQWGLIFLMGGGFAIAEGSKASGMSSMIADSFGMISYLPKYAILVILSFTTMGMVQFSSPVAVANIMLPVLADISRKLKVHPIYFMMPVDLTCTFCFCLPIFPPNAIATASCYMRTWEMIKVGIVVQIIAFVVLITVFPFLGGAIWDFENVPV